MSRRVAVVGAGVIGQVYAGRLAASGCEVWLLARGETLASLRRDGIRLRRGGSTRQPPVTVADSVASVPPVDVAYLAVRADQVDTALPVASGLDASVVVTLVSLADRAREIAAAVGADRVVLGFAGVGGERTAGGVAYHEIPQQPTTLGAADGREVAVAADLRAAGLRVAVVPDMAGWLSTHAVFIAGVGAAILHAGGSAALAADRDRSRRMVDSVGDGFRAMARAGTPATPRPLRMIFTHVPRLVSVPYWRRQLRGDLGRVALAPHVLGTRDTEMPLVAAAARRLAPDARLLDACLTVAGLPRSSG